MPLTSSRGSRSRSSVAGSPVQSALRDWRFAVRRTPVSSSNLVSVGYDAASETLEMEFHGARLYQYAGFPQHEYDAFMSASSLGSHFYHHIRDRYVTTEIL